MNKKQTIILVSLSSVVVIGLIILYLRKRSITNSKSLIPEESDPELSKKFNFHLIPDGKNNYRSAQFTMDVFPEIVKKYNIKNIIRLNGDGNDSKHRSTYPETSRKEEKEMCENLGCNYYFVNPHEGYKEGLGYIQSLEKINALLKRGNTLIHCTHGADRTGGMVGGYLKKNNIITNNDKLWEYTAQYNSWQDKINKGKFFGSGYDKYADTFYPINELKKSQWV
jgi:protein tyrosine/serine phosphatase